LRKGPEVGALGFRVAAQKLLVIVELLMGEIPHRSLFANKEFQKHLVPYLQIVNCVKQGEMEKFRQLLSRNAKIFTQDKNLALVHRLKHTVIKFGLKKINISYSKISLKDIQLKLALESVEETEQIVAKAIRDGVIEATINHD
jgi:26S proteasome regulatory subunit N3